ncbi:MAG: DUF882 domain-containing protein [Methylovulum sp.]|jgi:uncharacterized protein YcbK (DUF882 family)
MTSIDSDNDATRLARRKFLKHCAFGSMLALSSAEVFSATKHVLSPHKHPKKHAVSHTSKRSRHDRKPTPISKRNSPIPANAKTSPAIHTNTQFSPFHKSIALHNLNTGDKITLTYFEHGNYLHDALHEINYFARDYHTGSIHPIDLKLLDQLHSLQSHLGTHKPFQVISAYRSPLTNLAMHFQRKGVAKHSFHMEGRAIDIRIEGLALAHIKNAALSMQQGGVGYYPASQFVHLDTGPVRSW